MLWNNALNNVTVKEKIIPEHEIELNILLYYSIFINI